jgi:hypothetical protein
VQRQVRGDDADIDELIGKTIAKVGPSPKVVEETARLQAMLDASNLEPAPLVDPRSLPVRYSRLKLMDRSPAHYFDACQREDIVETLAIRLGAGAHGLLFGKPGDVQLYTGHRAGHKWEAFQRDRPGVTILNLAEWKKAMALVNAVRRNKLAHELLFDSTVREETIWWKCGTRACRSTPDARAKGRIVDLKTARSADLRWFSRDAFNRHYHVQLAFYDEAIVSMGGERADDLYLVAVETEGKHDFHPVTVFRIPDELRELGMKTWNLWFERLLVCEASNQWPEYAQTVVDLEPPFAIGGDAED